MITPKNTMSTLKTEGIILHSLDFKDSDQILTVFSLENGIMKLVFKGGQSSKRKKGAVSNPLTRAEFVYRNRDKELQSCLEISVFSQFLMNRKNLETLEASCQMIKAVQRTQLPGKPAPLLYTLLVKYLESVSKTPFPQTLASSFFLKLLRHDGHVGNLGVCSLCHSPLKALFLAGGEGFCEEHTPFNAIFIGEKDLDTFYKLLYAQELSVICNLSVTFELHAKAKRIFELIIAN